MVDETNTSADKDAEDLAADQSVAEPTGKDNSDAGETQATPVADDAGNSGDQPATDTEQSATADGTPVNADSAEDAPTDSSPAVTETPTDPTVDHGLHPQEPEAEPETPAESTDVTEVPQEQQPEQLDGVEYPDHQVPTPVSDAPTQETTNPEPETDEEGNVVVQVTQVANPEPEPMAALEAEPEVSNERVNVSMMMIDVATGEYPVSLLNIFAKNPQCSFPQEPLLHDINAMGYAVVQDTPQPTGDVISEGKPVEEDGVWKRTWEVREWNESEKADYLARKKTQATQKVETVRNDDFEMGMEFSFEGTTFHAQLRDSDRINLLYLNTAAQARLAANSTETEPFRSYENLSYELPPQELLDLTIAALGAYKAILRNSWAIKDLIDNAKTPADIPEVPATFLSSGSALKLDQEPAAE